MSTEECIHLLPVAQCALCNGRVAAERKAAKTVEYSFKAKFDGECGVCHAEVLAGEQVSRLGDGSIACESCTA